MVLSRERREALRHLLDAPIYHMSEAFAHPEHASTWVAAIAGDPPVWEDFLAEHAAGVDAPFSTCWRDLAAAFPDAPVLLSHRGSAKVWHRSVDATVLPRTHEMLMRDDDDRMVPLFRAIFADLSPMPKTRRTSWLATSGGLWRAARRSRRPRRTRPEPALPPREQDRGLCGARRDPDPRGAMTGGAATLARICRPKG